VPTQLPKTIDFTVQSLMDLPVQSLVRVRLTNPSGETRILVVPQRRARDYPVGRVVPLLPISA